MPGLLDQFSSLTKPTEEDLQKARSMGLLAAGLGLLQGSAGQGYRPSFGQALGQGGMQGLQAYNQQLAQGPQQRLQAATTGMKLMEMQDAMKKRQALEQLSGKFTDPAAQMLAQVGDFKGAVGRQYPEDQFTIHTVQGPNGPQLSYVPKRPGAGAVQSVGVQPYQSELDPNVQRAQVEMTRRKAEATFPMDLQKAAASAAKQQTLVNTFTPASEEAQKEFMKSSRTTYDQLKNAPAVLENIEKAKSLIPQARTFMGPGGETLLETTKFLNNRLGLKIETQGVKDAEELRSRIFFQIMENLKKMDAQPSQMQQIMMRDALGKLGTDPNALPAVLDAYGDVVRSKVSSYNREVSGAQERGIKFPYDPLIELQQGPAQPKEKPSGEWMEQKPSASQHRGKVIVDENGKRFRSDGMTWKPL